MKLIELHILQSFPVSCLNRDDVGAPKTATFGGVMRARISSQCLKRAIRLCAKQLCPALYRGERSKLIVKPLAEAAGRHGAAGEQALEASRRFCDELATFDEETFKRKGTLQVKTLTFLSPAEIEEIGRGLAEALKGSKDDKAFGKAIKSIASKIQAAKLKDAADIALFGRMVAGDHSLTVEGAAMFSHALSTHRAENDIDFFTAVDDLQPEDEAGSAMMAPLEFTSAVYYRYVGLNLDMLWDDNHLQALGAGQRSAVLDAFLRACMLAVPGARKNSMNAHTLPGYVLGVVKDEGQPIQLINAFEQPVRAADGLMDASIARLKEHHQRLKEVWGIRTAYEAAIPDTPLAAFCEGMLSHV
jgi:CRISPR system Cascade subunit CasC